jgi:hypothetical protein
VAALPGVRARPVARPSEPGAGRLVEKLERRRGDALDLGVEPIVIGSSRRECTILLPEHPDVAPVHARIWYRDGKYTLVHAGGFRRHTSVGGEWIERCVLEHGDEVQMGPHTWLYEELGNETPLRF